MKLDNTKQLLDMLNTDGGHILIALILLATGIFCLMRWHLAEGKELFIFALGILGMALKSTGKAGIGTGGPNGIH